MGAGSFLRSTTALLLLLSCANAGTGRHAEARRAGNVISVPANGDLQGAINEARPGDTIVLQPGARFVGHYRLPRKSGDEWITIQTSPSIFRRTTRGTRAQPSDTNWMAKLLASSGSAITAEPGAHHYRFFTVEIAPTPGTYLTNLIDLGNASTPDGLAHHLIFEHCYIHGDPAKGTRRGIALNSGDTTIVDSYLSDFKEVGADSQAIAGWNGPGPFKIVNNFLQGAGENVLFGGADPAIDGLVPSDIEIRANTISKPVQWRVGDPQYQGTMWSVKNLFELKNARRVRVEGNTLEYNWPQAQNGFAILFTVRNQDGAAPWSTVEDVTFTNNVVRHVASAFNILGHDDIHSSGPAHRITIKNNLFWDVGEPWGTGRLLQMLNGAADVTFDHNTALQSETILLADSPVPMPGFVFTNNIVAHNQYGIIGAGTGVGTPTLTQFFPGAVVRRNVFIGGNPSSYPGDNAFRANLGDIRFTNPAANDFHLGATSEYRGKALDGTDIGADIDAIAAAMSNTAGTTALDLPAIEAHASVADVPNDLAGTRMATVVLIVSSALLVYAYVGYAGAVWLLAKLRPKPIARRPIQPTVTVLVVAHNEARRIERRLANLLALEYPQDRLEIVVASDGSTDDTVAKAAAFGSQVRVMDFPVRRGKPAVLNDVIPALRSEIVVLADARQEFDRRAVAALVSCFGDPDVGCASGELILRPAGAMTAAAEGAAMYWNYEKLVRWSESQVDSTVGATGAIYAIRRSLFERVASGTILDDVLIPLRIARQGYRVVFEPDARAYDTVLADAHGEFVRKVRTMAGNVQLFAREPWLLRPGGNRLWFQTMSHKVIRLLQPALYAAIFLANIPLAPTGAIFQALLAAQVLFYASAFAAWAVPSLRKTLPFIVVPYQICFLNWAVVVGTARYLTRRQRVTWERPSAVPTPSN